ncbi:MAG: glycosyltransferase [Coriobacteriia bacterium]|nr:glycosyltransferase [Coriobacteriia bacterium]MCL2605939.1 glycosyltransferase [Coriobacteriia bacterium]
MKKALFVTTVPITLHAFLLPLAEALHKHGWQIDALTGASEDSRSELGVEFDTVHTVKWTRSPLSFLRYPKIARTIRQLVTTKGYQVVHVHTPIASLITRLALRTTADVRVIYTAHGFHFFKNEQGHAQGRIYRMMELMALPYTDVLVTMNDEDEAAAQLMAKSSMRLHGNKTVNDNRPQARESVYKVPKAFRCTIARIDGVGIDVDAYSPAALSPEDEVKLRKCYGLNKGSFVIATIAEMNHNKRHRLLLDAARKLPPEFQFLFIGTGPLEAALRKHAQQEQLSVSFTGQIDRRQLRELFALTNLGILVSEREGLPRSLMEFAAAGIPIAGTRTRGITDLACDKRAIAASATGTAIAEVISNIADNPQLAVELAEKQCRHISENCVLDVIIPQYLTLYE